MSTKGKIALDARSERLRKFINYIMKDGKRSLALKIVNNTFDIMRDKGAKDPIETFEKAIDNILPKVEVRPKRVGGSIYQVPQEVPAGRQFALASRWILASARAKSGTDFAVFLAQELMEASQETGNAFKKKLEVYKMAEANRANARFAKR